MYIEKHLNESNYRKSFRITFHYNYTEEPINWLNIVRDVIHELGHNVLPDSVTCVTIDDETISNYDEK